MKKILSLFICVLMISFTSFAEIPDISNTEIIAGNGEVYDTTTKGYTVTGDWILYGAGFENRASYIANGNSDTKCYWSLAPGSPTYYDVYYWTMPVENGDDQANVYAYATGNSYSNTTVNFADGTAGWTFLGTMYCSDNTMQITVTGSDTGKNIAATAFRMVKSTQEKFQNQNSTQDKKLELFIDEKVAKYDGKEIESTIGMAYIDNSRTMIPLRFVSEILGDNVEWDETESKAVIKSGNITLEFTKDSVLYTINGEEYTLDTPPQIKENRIYIPLRAYGEATSYKVNWDSDKRMASISK